MIRRTALFVVALLLGMLAPAQAADRPVFLAFDVDSTSLTYCNLSAMQSGMGRVETSGSSTTVTAVSGSTAPFAPVAVTDRLMFATATGNVSRIILAKASDISITVDSAINLDVDGGVAFKYQTYGSTCGTTSTAGWFTLGSSATVQAAPIHQVCVRIAQLSLASGNITYAVDTKNSDNYEDGPIQLLTGSFTSATYPDNGACVPLPEMSALTWIRIGLQIGGSGADDGGDTGANAEKVDVFVTE